MLLIKNYSAFKIRITILFTIAALFCLSSLLSCIKLENPYTIAESGITFEHGSMVDGDTMQVDEIKAIILDLELKEFLDKITVSAQGSNLWEDTSVNIGDVDGNKLTFYIRYSSNGQKQVRIETHLNNGRMEVDNLTLTLITYTDTIPPGVRVISKPGEYSVSSNSDTIISITDSIYLQLKIVETYSALNYNSFTINGGAFDKIEQITTQQAFLYKSIKLSGGNSAQEIVVTAKDSGDNICTKSYWIRKQKLPF